MTISHPGSSAISRHSGATTLRCDVRGYNLNAGCRVPGNPFKGKLVLTPNDPGAEPATVCFGPLDLAPDVNTFTAFVSSRSRPQHNNRLQVELQALDGSQDIVGRGRAELVSGASCVTTFSFRNGGSRAIQLRVAATIDGSEDQGRTGSVTLDYLLAYKRNRLIDLCNEAGSDKGTAAHCRNGVPHCYALDYFNLFNSFRTQRFNLLEIGLDPRISEGGTAQDAPSLRVWRRFFPRAQIYGYDVADFSFFEQKNTVTFQGDQASRNDLAAFLEHAGTPTFRVIIDDGSHASSHQQTSLGVLFRQLEPGGLYVIEDLNWQPYPESPTTLRVLRRFMSRGRIESPFIRAREARYLEANIDSIETFRPNDSEFAVITKSAASAGGRRKAHQDSPISS
jgi:hypothetical protein